MIIEYDNIKTNNKVRTYGAKALGRAESTHRAGTFYTSLVDYV